METLTRLHAHYGEVALPEPRDPFAAIVWENSAYLVDETRRAEVFSRLKDGIGITPVALLAAGPKRVRPLLEGSGMAQPERAARIVRCAELAVEIAGGDLLETLRALPIPKARAILKRFPSVGDPGADKLMLLAGLSDAPTLDSNGLRVLVRLGAIEEKKSYQATYKLGVVYLRDNGVDSNAKSLAAFMLLRHHGRELCKRSVPLCGSCPLRSACPSAR